MFTIKQNDTLPNLEAQLLDANGLPINLDLCGVHFHMTTIRGDLKINRSATIVNIETGEVSVEWLQTETQEIGMFKGEFEVNMPDGKIITVPNDEYFLISIVKELA